MNRQIWAEHLTSWKGFLLERLSCTEDTGDQIKTVRQLRTIERVRCGAVLNPALLTSFIEPLAAQTERIVCDEFSLDLNESQKNAVQTALANNELTLIQGPPGTGKTQVIAEICLQLYKKNPGIRILVCSETHVALNNLINRIAKQNEQIRIVRIHDNEKDDSIDEFTPDTLLEDYFRWASSCIKNKDAMDIITEELNDPLNKSLEKALALSANVVGMTCARTAAYDFRDRTEMFDVAIIDEVCKATLPEILAPLIIAKKAILLGDPKQLPPVFCSEDREILKSMENSDLQNYMYIDDLFTKAGNTLVLDTQYRMENTIGNLISTIFYEGVLKNGRNVDVPDSLLWVDYKPSCLWPKPEEYAEDKTMIRNLDECAIIGRLLDNIEKTTASKKDVAVIVPYRKQKSELLSIKGEYSKLSVTIDTVDGFQGKEADVVVFGVTRTYGNSRFITDYQRLNVALSRAKDQLIIVGNMEYASKNRLLNEIIGKCKVITA